MLKRPFVIDNTRFIWTQTILLDLNFLPNGKLRNGYDERTCRIAFSHGIRDCEEFRTKNNDNNFEEAAQDINLEKIKDFLLGSKEWLRVFDISTIEKKNDFKKEDVGSSPQKIIYAISLKESIFLMDLPKGNESIYNTISEKERETLSYEDFLHQKEEMNNKRHLIGFLYTKSYLFGFFYGLLRYIRRDTITGFYHFTPKGLYCFYKGYNNSNYDFIICTDSKDVNEEDYDVDFNNSHLLV